jgi:ribosomal protein S18 acetylase RimI-like enzyme
VSRVLLDLLRTQDRSVFSCGDAGLDDYLKKQARQDMRRGYATVIAASYPEAADVVIGYYSLAATSMDLTSLPGDMRRKMPRYGQVPATLLGRLAVDMRAQGQGHGALLLADALVRAHKSELAWAVFLVRAKHEKAAAFYGHFGFTSFSHKPLLLWLTRNQVQKLPWVVE